MKIPLGRAASILLFVALLAATIVLNRMSAPGKTTSGSQPASDGALSRYGFQLQEVSRSVGIDFTHEAPRFDPKLDHIMPQVAMTGAGVSVADFDRDGWQDLYITNSGEG